MFIRVTRRALLLAALAPFAAHAAPATIDGPALDMIPRIGKPLSVFRFAAEPSGQSFVRETLARTVPRAAATAVNGTTRFLDGARVAGFSSPDGNDAEIFADLNRLPPGYTAGNAAGFAAKSIFARADVLPADDTAHALASPSVIAGGDSRTGKAANLLTYVAARRLADGLPVLGEGSRAAIGIGLDGSVQAFVKHWRPAHRAESITPSLTPGQVRAAIIRQLARYETATQHVRVDRVGLGYYDGNGDTLQPVYYFTARLLPRPGTGAIQGGGAVIGYLPIGTPTEAVPALSTTGSAADAAGVHNFNIGSNSTLGEYVTRNDDPNWVNDANAFAGALGGAGTPRTEYYWAQPFEYLGSANAYVNAVTFAVTESHGDWWLFSTWENSGSYQAVSLGSIGSGGNPAYGGWGNGNKLAHWWIHSCEVIPSMFDENLATGNSQTAFNVWWNIFGGLHQAIGYRTIMFIADGAGAAYGQALAQGGGLTSAWLNSVLSLSDYNQGWTYPSNHFANRNVPYGMPSVMSLPGIQNETAFTNGADRPAAQTGLWNYWATQGTD
jgi:hypothetical protein